MPLPLAVIVVAGLVVPLFASLLRIGGIARMVIEYAATGCAVSRRDVAGDLCFGPGGRAHRGVGATDAAQPGQPTYQARHAPDRLVAATAILIRCGDELGFPAYSVLAGLGVGGLAVALAAQSTIANLIGSLLIALEKPFRVGHLVRIGGSEGTVEDVGFRSTRIRTPTTRW